MTSRRVLVVDDNVDSAASIAAFLKLSGHEVRMAHDGTAAIEAARQMRPEFVFLDLGLPGMDGFEVARRLRMEPGVQGARIIALSGFGQEADRQRSLEAGIDQHLVKPADLSFLASLLGSPRQ
jgi:two-component system CheB/CheR fusion protein